METYTLAIGLHCSTPEHQPVFIGRVQYVHAYKEFDWVAVYNHTTVLYIHK